MRKPTGKQKKRDVHPSDRRSKKRISKASRPSASYRETTRELLKTFPELPTGPSRRNRSNPDELPAPQPPHSELGFSHPEEARETESDIHAGEMEQNDDYHSCYDEDGVFSGNSCGSSIDEGMVDRPQNKSGNLIDLPVKIWGKILALLHPLELAQLRTYCRFFDNLLKQDVTWRASRNSYLPELPKPILGLSEFEMFQLLFGSRCMLCEAQKDIRTYWPFRINCCKRCLSDNTTKEFLLRCDPDPLPLELSDALPFGMVDAQDNWIPNPINYQPNIGITRLYWNKDLVSIKERYEEAKEMLAADEWLKGLESERDSHFQDVERIERFERTRSADLTRGNALWRHLCASNIADSVSENLLQDENGTVKERGNDKGLKTAKQQEIEDRCFKFDPPLTLETLVHLPTYQASIVDDKPLSYGSWEALKTSLLQEHSVFREQKRSIDSAFKTKSERSRESLSSISKAWVEGESVQLSNRAKLASHAEEIIREWNGNLSTETVPKFSTEVLLYCRKQFLADESTRRKRLTLDDMKHVFDVKIKPLAHPHRVEMFLCNGCPKNPRWWGFESLVQHYTAKHTYNPRGRPAKVNWRADWPDIGPFRSDPEKAKLEALIGTPANTFTIAHSAREPARPYEDRKSSSPRRWAQDVNHSVSAAPRQGSTSLGRDEPRYGRLDLLAADARDAWFQLANIRDIPSSVLVHFVITRTARKYQTRFSQAISLSLFMEALSEHQAMKPIRAANGLGCIECQRHPGKPLDCTSKVDRLFPIISLLQHFETVHVKRNKSAVVPDWTRDMVRLPHPRVISALADSKGVDTEKRYLLEDIFPWAFVKGAKHEWVRSLDGAVKPKSDLGSGRGSVVPCEPRHVEPFVIGIPQSISERDTNGIPISQDRLQQFQFVENNSSLRNMDANYRSARRDAIHDQRPSLGIDMVRRDSTTRHAHPVEINNPSLYYLNQRDRQYKLQEESARQGSYQQLDTRRRVSRPSAADFMDAQSRAQRPVAANYYGDLRYGRNHDPASYPGSIRRRSRSPVNSDLNDHRYREGYPLSGADGHGIPVGYMGPRCTYPPPNFYRPAEMGDYVDPYRPRPPHGYYAPPHLPPPPPLMIPHMSAADCFYEAQAVRSGSPASSIRYPPPLQRMSMTDRPLPNDRYEDYKRLQPR